MLLDCPSILETFVAMKTFVLVSLGHRFNTVDNDWLRYKFNQMLSFVRRTVVGQVAYIAGTDCFSIRSMGVCIFFPPIFSMARVGSL